MHASKPKRRRRVDSGQTRARILDAARAIFAAKGYAQCPLSDIADAAGVSSALVVQHFQTKAALFEQALAGALDQVAPSSSEDDFGQMVTDVLADDASAQQARRLIAHSVGAEEVRESASRLVEERLLAPLAESSGDPRGFERAAMTVALAVGYATLGMLMPAKRGKLADRRLVGQMIGETVQQIAA